MTSQARSTVTGIRRPTTGQRDDPAAMRTVLMRIGPAEAADFLKGNTLNRVVRPRRVKEIISDIEQGRWEVTHQGIGIADDGTLMDGQHRLMAIVASGKTVEMLVSFGVTKRAFDVIDSGLARATGDRLQARGYKNGSQISAIATACIIGLRTSTTVPAHEKMEFVHRHHEVISKYLDLGRKHSAAVAAAFVKADMCGWEGTVPASDRLFSLLFNGGGDPMRALAIGLECGGAKGTSQNRAHKYAIAVSALRAIEEGRVLYVVRRTSQDIA